MRSFGRELLAGVLAAVAGLAGCKLGGYSEARSAQIVQLEKSALDQRGLGAARFVFDDLGGLSTHTLGGTAYPWKVVVTALAMQYAEQNARPLTPDLAPEIFRQFGWIVPSRIDNWPSTQQPINSFDKPIGFVAGELRRKVPRMRLEIVNLGCASCHGGQSYDEQGNATGRIWLGSPNSSLYFDAYTEAIFSALRRSAEHPKELLRAIPVMFPRVHRDELSTIRKYVLPQIAQRLREAAENGELLIPFDNGGPGLTNGLAALKLRLGSKLAPRAEHGYVSIPDLYARRLRSSFLYDGAYALRADARFVERSAEDFSASDWAQMSRIEAFFLVPSMGVTAEQSLRQAARLSDILVFVLDYQPQPYPGPIDRAKASAGRSVYDAACATCHGEYAGPIEAPRLERFPNRFVPQSKMNSDPERWRAIDEQLVRKIKAMPVNAATGQGYVAPILGGIWASAPYLHNGSVPTLWHLMHPTARPKSFYVGGHKLDLEKLGIAGEVDAQGVYRYPQGYTPWSRAMLFDATRPGFANTGHETEFNALSEQQRSDLLEFLKLI